MAAAFALSASLAWGISDFLGGIKSRTVALLTVLLVSQSLGTALMAVLALVHGHWPGAGLWMVEAFLAAVTGTIGLAALYGGIAVGLVTLVAPVAATAPILPLIVGLLAGERPRPLQLAGAGLALVGVILLSLRPGAGQPAGRRRRGAGIGVGLAVLASICFGCFYLTLAVASRRDVVWATMIQRLSSVCLLAATALLLRRWPMLHRKDLSTLATVGILDVGANVLYGAASAIGSITLVPVLASSLYPIEGVVLARFVLHERIARLQQAGVVMVIAGVALVSA